MKNPRLFLFAGEASGDLHGSHLIKALKQQMPTLKLEGVAGPKMRAEGVDEILSMEEFQVMGITDVLKALPRLYKHFYRLRDHILSSQPEGIVLIDYPGFNLRLAKALRAKKYAGKIVHYVSPTVWACGRHRIEEMAKTLDLLLTIYPFEASYFQDTSLQVAYVGNPLCEYLEQYQYNKQWRESLGIPADQPLIALFPGSRLHEVQRHLPMMLEAASQYKRRFPEAIFAISGEPNAEIAFPTNLQNSVYWVPGKWTYELMRDSDLALAKSGTVTLELALHQRPTVVIYQLTWLNRLYAKYILKLNLPHYCIVNILSQQCTFPELIEKGLSTDNIFHHLASFSLHKEKRESCQTACRAVHQSLSGFTSSQSAAETILKVMAC